MGGLKAAQQLVESVKHLLRQAFAHYVLELAAFLEECGEALDARHSEEPCLTEKEPQRGRDRPSCSLDHVLDAEIQPSRAFAARR